MSTKDTICVDKIIIEEEYEIHMTPNVLVQSLLDLIMGKYA
jgi:hypothetical protein